MAVVDIQKINLIAHQSSKKEILETLYDKGFVEITSSKKEEGDKEEGRGSQVNNKANTEFELAKVKYALDFLLPFSLAKKSFREKMVAEKPIVSLEDINELKSEFDYPKISEKAETLGQRVNTLKSLINKLEEEKKQLTAWLNLEMATQELETSYTKTILGIIPVKNYPELKEVLTKKFKELEVLKVNEDDANVYLSVTFNKTHEKELTPLLSEREFKNSELPKFAVTPRQRIKLINQEIEESEKENQIINKEAAHLAKEYLTKLKAIYDLLYWQLDQEQVQENFSHTTSTFSVMGWVKKKELPTLKKVLQEITSSVEITTLKPEENEAVPVAVENPKILKPFEFVTGLYGLPKSTEVDPTPFLAGFFILFFGLCLTDAGYGLTLAVVSFIALKFFKLKGDMAKLTKVLFYGGIVTFVAGGLTGGWFGIVLEDLPSALGAPLMAIRQLDPVADPITMLIISLILGYIHLFYGSAIDLWWKIKHGATKEGFLSSGVWMYFLLTLGFFIITSQGIALASASKIAVYLIYSALALIVFTQGKSKNFIMKILGGLAELYFGLTGYISDILSYSRLLALGLATGIIGMVINIIGMMLKDMIPYVGWFLMVVVLIGGHLFNLIISLVGAFIHSGRLHYVEFFKKFFEGGGKAFSPFVRESKYVELKK